MQPLPLKTRRMYFYTLILVFIAAVPFLILYALGYRFDEKLLLIPTGGLYIATDRGGAEVFLNDEQVRETGTFRKAFFIQNLEPGTISVRVSKPDYYSWSKNLDVEAHVVTEATAFMLPTKPVLREIPALTTLVETTGTTTSTSTMLSVEHTAVLELFGLVATTTKSGDVRISPIPEPVVLGPQRISSSTSAREEETSTTTKESQGIALVETNGGLSAMWVLEDGNAPYYFCDLHGECITQIPINTRDLKVSNFDFFPGRSDVVLITREDGIYATEIDPRGGQNTQSVYSVSGADFRLGARGEIYVRNGNEFFEVML